MTTTPVHWKLVVDAHDPHAQAGFWAAALHYEDEDHSVLIGKLLGLGAIGSEVVIERHRWRGPACGGRRVRPREVSPPGRR